jgi:hypothetical protein
MAHEIEILFLGWLLGVISSLLIPEWRDYRKKSKEKLRFRNFLQIEIQKLKTRLQNEIKKFYDEYGISGSKHEEIDLAYSLINYFPKVLGKKYDLNFYHENYKGLTYLDEEERNEIINLFERLSRMNFIIKSYEDFSHSENDVSDKSIRDFKGKLISTYFGHLKVANEEINAF